MVFIGIPRGIRFFHMNMNLRAEWRKLVMLHYPVNPDVLRPYLPFKTELETWNDHHYISMVGFIFSGFRVNGIPLLFHQRFPEINLRFYVRHREGDVNNRGVVFINEFVNKPIVTFGANQFYHQHYRTLPMRHALVQTHDGLAATYRWKNKSWHEIHMQCANEGSVIQANSMEEFFTDQAWGFAKVSDRKTLEYRVDHPRWSIYDTQSFTSNIDFEQNYGSRFAFLNHKEPEFAFMAEGSAIELKKSRWIV